MFIAGSTLPSGYSPAPPRRTNPLLIVLGVCGGCVLIAIIIMFAGGAYIFNKLGGTVSRSIAATQFVQDMRMHQYAQAENLFTPQEQQALPTDQLTNKMESLETKYGALQTGSPQPIVHQARSNDLNQLNQITDYNVLLSFANGSHSIILHFDTTPGQTNKIAGIDWNPGEESGGAGNTGGGRRGRKGGGGENP